jgi:hypothetical protein
VQLNFDAATHTYRLNGAVVPSVTQVLDEQINDWTGVPQDVLEAARVFGSHVHQACHLMVRDELDWASLDPSLVPYVEAAKRFIDESGITILSSELALASPKLKFAGTLDIRGLLRDSVCLLDWKSTSTLPRSVGPQTAAYDHLYIEQHGGRPAKRYCVQLNPALPHGYKVHALTNAADWSIFLSALNCWRFKHAN